MDFLRILLSRAAALLRIRKLDVDLDEELQAHVDLAIEENLRRGMTAENARMAALREFGGVTQIKESYRQQRGMPWLEQIGRDVRFGVRQLRKSPGFTITAVLTLALGLGANTAIFSLINALLLRPLPVAHAEQLAVLTYFQGGDPRPSHGFPTPLMRALEKRHEIFQEVAAYSGSLLQVRGSASNVEVSGALVSGQYFALLQVQPVLGRALSPQDDQAGGGSTGFGVVITEGFWRSWFNRAPDVVGRTLTIANAPFTVVGVMPASFTGADPINAPQIYVPLSAEPIIDAPDNNLKAGYHSWWLTIFARRKATVSLEQANAALSASTNAILDETADEDADWLKHARANHFLIGASSGSKGYTYLRDDFEKPLVAIFMMCAAMLLLACLNLASLLMARSAARERELATRLAMGATRRRLVQQLLVESLLIALLGTTAGLVAAPMVSNGLAVFVLGNNRGASLDTTLDLRVLLFVTVTAILATVVVGLVPALRATSKNLSEQIKNGSLATTSREHRSLLPRVMMSLEVSLALILVVGAGLLATSLTRLYRTGLGFEPKGLVNFSFNMSKQSLDGDALVRWYQDYGDTLRHSPGVKSLSFASDTPMDGNTWIESYHSPSSSGDHQTYMTRVAPEYFKTMGIPLLAGRDYRWSDTRTSGLKIILNASAAKTLFPGQNAIGQHIQEGKKDYEVVGLVGDVHYSSIQKAAPAGGYVPMMQDEGKKPSYTAIVRVDGPVLPLADAARTLAAKMSPDIPAPAVTSISSDVDDSISSERMMALLAGFFAACALLVTAIGLYGTLAYATARRTSEIGIRMALGAQRMQVVSLVFRENAWVAAGGSLAGLIVALVASRALASFLYGTSVRDPWVLAGSVMALAITASAASLVPALRASRIEPIQALRSE